MIKILKFKRLEDFQTFFLILGLILLPFSTKARQFLGLPSLSYGTPFFIIFSILTATTPIKLFPKKYSTYAFLGLWLIVIELFSLAYATYTTGVMRFIIADIIGISIFFYMAFYCRQKNIITTVIPLLILSACIISIYYVISFTLVSSEKGFLYTLVAERTFSSDTTIIWGASNVIASTLIVPLFLSIYMFKVSPSKHRINYIIATVILAIGILISLSRGAILATLFGLAFLVTISGLKYARKMIIALLLFLAFAYAIDTAFAHGLIFHDLIGTALVYRLDSSDIETGNMRTEVWSNFIKLGLKSPLLGQGYGSLIYVYGASGHNVLLSTFVELGIIGLIPLITIILALSIRVITNIFSKANSTAIREFYRYMGAGGLAAMIHLQVEDAHFTQQYKIYLWIFFAIVVTAKQSMISGSRQHLPSTFSLKYEVHSRCPSSATVASKSLL